MHVNVGVSTNDTEFKNWGPEKVSAFIATIFQEFKDYRGAIVAIDLNGAMFSVAKTEEEIKQQLSTLECAIRDFKCSIITENIFEEITRPINNPVQVIDGSTLKKTYPFPTLGISLKGHRECVERCRDYVMLIGLMTTEVNETYQKLITFSKKLSYCDLMYMKGSRNVGVALVLVSHA